MTFSGSFFTPNASGIVPAALLGSGLGGATAGAAFGYFSGNLVTQIFIFVLGGIFNAREKEPKQREEAGHSVGKAFAFYGALIGGVAGMAIYVQAELIYQLARSIFSRH